MADNIQQLTPIAPSQPGHLQQVWSKANHQLYHKLSPYANFNQNSLLNFGAEQPFNYTWIDQASSFPNVAGKYESRSFPVFSAIQDTIRMSRFLTSGNGVLFLSKQILLNSGNAFNETRLYSPTEVLVSAARPATLGLTNRVTRHIDTSGGGLMGILGSLVGIGSENSNQPSGTVAGPGPFYNRVPGDSDGEHISTPYRGLSRAGTANAGLARLNTKWNVKNTGAGFFGSLFSNFIPATQTGIIYKSCEGTYGKMITNDTSRLWSIAGDGTVVKITQRWVAGGAIMRKDEDYPYEAARMFTNPLGRPYEITNSDLASLPNTIDGSFVGYDINKNSKGGLSYRYGDNVGTDASNKNQTDFTNSDVIIQYQNYVDPKTLYKSKQADTSILSTNPATILNNTLQAVLDNIKTSITGNSLYTISVPDDSRIIGSGQSTDNGYNRLYKTNIQSINSNSQTKTGINYPLGVLSSYRSASLFTPVDDSTASPIGQSKRMPASNLYDAINTLTVITSSIIDVKSFGGMTGWNNKKWEPYKHDQIAFYFYDIVNQNYIPFRASITGINEGGTANWEQLSFIGRADKVYSYSGFTRTLSFKFTVNISSIAELAPTWQRINYLSTLIKPSNYTSDVIAANNKNLESSTNYGEYGTGITKQGTQSTNNIANRFMIPPMIYLNVGDMYRDQPVVITNVATSIPDDASWETLNEDNSDEWSYLADYIKAPNMKYGQLPRTIDINVTMNLLEKEQPIAGGANFGHAPRNNIFKTGDYNDKVGKLTKMNKSLVVDVNK